MRSDENYTEGRIEEALADMKYRVTLSDGRSVLCYAAGKIKMNHIRIVIGDRVGIILDPYGGKATNRIVRRL